MVCETLKEIFEELRKLGYYRLSYDALELFDKCNEVVEKAKKGIDLHELIELGEKIENLRRRLEGKSQELVKKLDLLKDEIRKELSGNE